MSYDLQFANSFNEALDKFRDEMEAKLRARDSKHGERSIVRMNTVDAIGLKGLWKHFQEEVQELLAEPTDRTEMIDVANMCFALWWQQYAVEQLTIANEQSG